MNRGNPGTETFTHLLVHVDEIGPDGVASVVDEFSRPIRINTSSRLGKGPLPRPGERWFVQSLRGGWAFSSCLVQDLPVLTGTDVGASLSALATLLAEMGLIDDQTTIDSTHPDLSEVINHGAHAGRSAHESQAFDLYFCSDHGTEMWQAVQNGDGTWTGTWTDLSLTTSVTAADVSFVPAGGITSTDVQAAITELGTTKVADTDPRLTDSRPPSGPAGGDLTGTYPNPTVANGAITDTKVAAANKDGLAAVASLRTLGTGAQQAAAGNDPRLSDSRTPVSHTHAEADVTSLVADLAAKVPTSRTIATGTGLSGGGDLSADRSLSVVYGTAAGTSAQGNDSRLSPLNAWPVGSLFFSVVATNPATLLGGGTWVAWGTGRVPVGIDTSDIDFNTVEKTGGAKSTTYDASNFPHTHTQPAHTHSQPSHSHTLASHTHSTPAHDHGIAHTHSTPAHDHGIAHTHSTPNHSHSLNGHVHSGPNHRHQIAVAGALNTTATGGSTRVTVVGGVSPVSGGGTVYGTSEYEGTENTGGPSVGTTPGTDGASTTGGSSAANTVLEGGGTTGGSGTLTTGADGNDTTGSASPTTNDATAGAGTAVNAVQPYVTCYIWKRTA